MRTPGNSAQNGAQNTPYAKDFQIGVVVSEWNSDITENLFKGAKETFLKENGLEGNLIRWDVPGSFELVYGSKKMSEVHPDLDAIIVIGCVIQGETKHFDFVCEGVTHGIKELNLKGDIPVIFCVLTDNTRQQSIERSGGKLGNKGSEAAVAALKMGEIRRLK